MPRNLIRLMVFLVVIGVAGEFVSPPLSCWITKGFVGSVDPGRTGGPTMMQPGMGVGPLLRQLIEPPAETSGSACRARLAHAFGLG